MKAATLRHPISASSKSISSCCAVQRLFPPTIWNKPPSLTVSSALPCTTGPLRGVLFVPPGKGPHPGILVLGGSKEACPPAVPHGSPPTDTPPSPSPISASTTSLANSPAFRLGTFGQALVWMANRPEIDPNRLAVSGTSRGGELALQLSSIYTGIKAVVAFRPGQCPLSCLLRSCFAGSSPHGPGKGTVWHSAGLTVTDTRR